MVSYSFGLVARARVIPSSDAVYGASAPVTVGLHLAPNVVSVQSVHVHYVVFLDLIIVDDGKRTDG